MSGIFHFQLRQTQNKRTPDLLRTDNRGARFLSSRFTRAGRYELCWAQRVRDGPWGKPLLGLLTAVICAAAVASFFLIWGYPNVMPNEIVRPADSLDFVPSSTEFQPGNPRPESFYANLPVSAHRPSGQYYTPPEQAPIKAVITIITPTYNPRNEISRAARFVQEQSLQAYRWIIVNDHSTDVDSLKRLEVLKDLASKDWRIRVLNNPGPRGGPSAMNFGIRQVKTPYVAILDDDDLWELTTLEKAVLVMSWVRDAYAVGFDVINHGSKEFIWTRGFHQGDENYYFENGLVQGSPLRTEVFEHCQFDTDMAGGAADWDLWMCMASHGMWGMHVPENGTWYQFNSDAFRSQRWKKLASADKLANVHARIVDKYKSVLGNDDAWKMVLPPRLDNGTTKSIHWGLDPFENIVAPFERKRLLIILTSLRTCSLLIEILRHIQSLASDGWRITVVLTHFVTGHHEMRERIMRYTHDIFTAPLIAPAGYMPQLIRYLIHSRGIRFVLVAQSRFGYAMLPAIAAAFPDIRLVDYIADCSAKAGRVGRESVKMDRFLDLTIAPTTAIYDCILQHGKPEDKLVVTRGGINLCECASASRESRQRMRTSLGLGSDQALVVVETIEDPNLASDIFETMLAIWRKSMSFRVLWVNASQHVAKSLANDAGDLFVQHTAEYGAYQRAADVIVSMHGDSYLHNAAMLGCGGAAVITDGRPAKDEPPWEWGRGLVCVIQRQSRYLQVVQYARMFQQVLQIAKLGGSVEDVELASSKLEETMRQGQVVCNISVALRQAWSRNDRDDVGIVSAARLLRESVEQELADSSRVFDMRYIQNLMQFRKKRTGFGRTLQLKCPERVQENTKWIDALENVKGCGSATINKPLLRAAALEQCNSACIADLDLSHRPYGWHLQGDCWAPVADAGPCMAIISSTRRRDVNT
jgi:glycosyltransferase involved in cell wall biosynthesis